MIHYVYYSLEKKDTLLGKIKEQVIGGLVAVTMKGVYLLEYNHLEPIDRVLNGVSKMYGKYIK
ncbi:hypothetical protein CL619_01990 [archaeon]|nr:hypothetical protein [archaeon]